jgi:hypothetical protein
MEISLLNHSTITIQTCKPVKKIGGPAVPDWIAVCELERAQGGINAA